MYTIKDKRKEEKEIKKKVKKKVNKTTTTFFPLVTILFFSSHLVHF